MIRLKMFIAVEFSIPAVYSIFFHIDADDNYAETMKLHSRRFYLASMYSKEQASKLKTQFWTSLGQYMKPVPGASGLPVNWINYKTGIRNIHLKMDVGNTRAIIAMEISHPQDEQRLQYYNQFVSLKKILASTGTFNWQWNETIETDHKTVSSITQQLDDVNILNQADWPAIISFLKPRIIALDAFWDMVKDGFE